MSEMTNAKGKLFVYSGCSGVGKGTIMKELLKADSNIRLSVSATTRAPRPGETHGVEYFFVSKEEFDQIISQDGFLEYAGFCGNFYGTPKKPVFDMLEKGISVFLEIDVVGALNVIREYPDCVSIFVLPPSLGDLESRLRNRGTETEEQIAKRLGEAQREIDNSDKYKYNVVNDKLEDAIAEILDIVKKETGR